MALDQVENCEIDNEDGSKTSDEHADEYDDDINFATWLVYHNAKSTATAPTARASLRRKFRELQKEPANCQREIAQKCLTLAGKRIVAGDHSAQLRRPSVPETPQSLPDAAPAPALAAALETPQPLLLLADAPGAQQPLWPQGSVALAPETRQPLWLPALVAPEELTISDHDYFNMLNLNTLESGALVPAAKQLLPDVLFGAVDKYYTLYLLELA
ncbi:hypothetical protein GGR52DRAFT_576076 [Hypoxylon sp. FL1284]|nr:hypothetical protein GGR52DRAFT_576076 [Hypoxylon sp. FL1284]